MAENEQFGGTLDSVRRELDSKIENKVSHNSFYSVLGILVVIAGSVLAYMASQVGDLNDKNEDLAHRVTVLETKFGVQR